MSPIPSRNTAVPEAEANEHLPRFVAGIGYNNQVHVLRLRNDRPYWCCSQHETAQWEVKNEERHKATDPKFKALISSPRHKGSLHVVGLTQDGKPHLACSQDEKGNWQAARQLRNKDNQTYRALITGIGRGKHLYVMGLTDQGKPYMPCYQGDNDGNWEEGAGALRNPRKATCKALVTGVWQGSYLHVVGLTDKGKPDVLCYQKPSGEWIDGDDLSNIMDDQKYIALVTGKGADGTLQLVGLTDKGKPRVPCFRHQDHLPGWQKGTPLPNPDEQTYSALVTGKGTDGKLQVVGLTDKGKPYLICYHEAGISWEKGRSLPNPDDKTYSALVTAEGVNNTLLVLGLDKEENPWLVCWQDPDGEWHAGPPLTKQTIWVGVGKVAFDPPSVSIKSKTEGVAFYLQGRGTKTTLKATDGLFWDDFRSLPARGGVSYQRISEKFTAHEGKVWTTKHKDKDLPNEPMEGSITVSKGGGH